MDHDGIWRFTYLDKVHMQKARANFRPHELFWAPMEGNSILIFGLGRSFGICRHALQARSRGADLGVSI